MIPDTKYEHCEVVDLECFSVPLSSTEWYNSYSSSMKTIHFCAEMGAPQFADKIIEGSSSRRSFVTVEYKSQYYKDKVNKH